MGKLIAAGQFGSNLIAAAYRKYLMSKPIAASTVNIRIAALKGVFRFARILGLVTWGLEIRQLTVEQYKETKGPGSEAVQEMMVWVEGLSKESKALCSRNKAIVRLLYDCALRRKEITTLELEDVDVRNSRLLIRGKGRHDSEWIPLSQPTLESLMEWIANRGHWAGPMFLRFTKQWREPYIMTSKRLLPNGLYKMIRKIGRRIGKEVKPHGLRHSAITEALTLTNGDVASVAAFSRHKNLNTLQVYDDNRQERAKTVSDLVAMKKRS